MILTVSYGYTRIFQIDHAKEEESLNFKPDYKHNHTLKGELWHNSSSYIIEVH